MPDITLEFKTDRVVIEQGEALKLSKKLKTKNVNVQDIKWTSSNEKTATIENGVLKTHGTGTVEITASYKDFTTTFKVTVASANVKISKISVKPAKKVLYTGDKITLEATVKAKPDLEVNKKVIFESSNESVATVSSKGVVKALKAGTATITVKSLTDPNKVAKCNLVVKQLVTGIKMQESKELYVKDTFTLEAAITPADATNKKLTWTTSNKNIATVNSKGVVKALKAGTATITAKATDGSKVSATCVVTVKEKPNYQGVVLQYSARYNVSKNPLTKKLGVVYYNGHKETFYSQKVLPGGGLTALNNNGRHVALDGTIRDKDGYIAVACNYLPQGSRIMTSLGPGKVYDTGTMTRAWIDIYVNW